MSITSGFYDHCLAEHKARWRTKLQQITSETSNSRDLTPSKPTVTTKVQPLDAFVVSQPLPGSSEQSRQRMDNQTRMQVNPSGAVPVETGMEDVRCPFN